MHFIEVHRKPVPTPRPRTPSHVPDSGSGLIVLSCVILLLAVIRKKLGWFPSRPGW